MGAHRFAIAPAPRPPRAREDLEVHERELDGRPVFVVHDPVLGSYHQLGAAAFAVLETLENGDVPVGNLPRELRQRYELVLPLVEAGKIVDDLEKLGLLEVTPEQAAARGESADICAALERHGDDFYALQAELLKKWRPAPPRIRRLRLHLWNPERTLERLSGWGQKLFTRRAAILTGLLALFALTIQLEHGARLRLDLARSFAHPFFFLAVALGVTFLHELGHGLACHVFGGRVRDVGVMLLFFCIPAAYCDVSDAHLIESRGRRAVVALAGCYVNIILWIAATLLWRTFESDTLVARASLGVIATTSLSLVVNLNPLLPLDGYYAAGELVGGTLRSRPIYRWASGIYIWIIIPTMLLHLFRFLVGEFRLFGFAAFLGIAFVMMRPLCGRVWQWVMDG